MEFRLPQYQQDTWSKSAGFSLENTGPSPIYPYSLPPANAQRATTFESKPGLDDSQRSSCISRHNDSIKFFAQNPTSNSPSLHVVPPPPRSNECSTMPNRYSLVHPVTTINPITSYQPSSKTPTYIKKYNLSFSPLRHRTSLPALITSALPSISSPSSGTALSQPSSSASLLSSPLKPRQQTNGAVRGFTDSRPFATYPTQGDGQYATADSNNPFSFRSAESSPRQVPQISASNTMVRYRPRMKKSLENHSPDSKAAIDLPNSHLLNNSPNFIVNTSNAPFVDLNAKLKPTPTLIDNFNPWSYAQPSNNNPFPTTNHTLNTNLTETPLELGLFPAKKNSAHKGGSEDIEENLFYGQTIPNKSFSTVPLVSYPVANTNLSNLPPASTFRVAKNGLEIQKPFANKQPQGRRATPNGGYMSPLIGLTTQITSTYHLCNPKFSYEISKNPKRVLTNPSKAVFNNGLDNVENDYILYVNDTLGDSSHQRYLVLDSLGKGTFGQVVKCQNLKTRELVAIKVIKNKTAFLNQSRMEISILEHINNNLDKWDQHHILRLKDRFMYKNHLFLVFELLSSNLYEFIKQNEYKGFSLGVIRVFSSQLLDALKLLNQAKIVHCDLKPENILLKSLGMLDIKIIDLGSACYEQQTIYTYIQSRFYRAPEIILGIPYNTSIDMWSLGCIVAELFLGLPLFPGSSEYNQLSRIIQTIGMPPNWMIEKGKNSTNFFTRITDTPSQRYRLKSLDEYSKEQNVEEVAGKKYLASTDLEQNIMSYPLPRTDMTNLEIEQEMKDRKLLINFIQGLLNYNPLERWTPQQALSHPFIIGSNKSAGGTITLPSVTKSSNLDTGFRDLVNDNTKHTTLKLSKPSIDLNNKKPFIGHPSSGSSEIYDITSISHVQSNQKKNRYDDIKSYDCDLNSKMQFNLKL